MCGIKSENDEIGMLMQDLQILVWNSLLEQKNTTNSYLSSRSLWINPIVRSYLIHNCPNNYFKFKVVFF